MTTPLQLDAYCVDRFEVIALDGFKQARGSVELAIDVEPKHLTKSDDSLAHQLALDVRFAPKGRGSAPYRGRIAGRAFFHVADDLDEEATARFVLVNGSAILLGLLRAHIAQATALGRWGPLLLPPVNLIEAFATSAEASDSAGADDTERRTGSKPRVR